MFEVRGIICAGCILGRTRRDVLMSCLCVRVHVHVEHVRKQMQHVRKHAAGRAYLDRASSQHAAGSLTTFRSYTCYM